MVEPPIPPIVDRRALEVHAPPRLDPTDVSLKEYADSSISAVDRRVDAGNGALHEHITTQYKQIEAALEASRREFTFARQSAAEALSKTEDVLNTRIEEGDIRLREHMVSQTIALEAALESARREASFARDSADRALSKLEQTLRTRIEEGDQRLRDHVTSQYAQISNALESARRETGFAADASQKAIDKAESATNKAMEKTELSTDKQFENMRMSMDTSWEASRRDRQQITDRVNNIEKTYSLREPMDVRIAELAGRVEENRSRMLPRETFEGTVAAWADWRNHVDAQLQRSQGQQSANRRHEDRFQPWMIWAMGALLTLVVIAVNALFN